MKKALFLAAAAGTLLVSAAPPGPAMPGDEGVDYPPCSRSVHDRCIQLHERGVATPENLAINRGDSPPDRYTGDPEDDMPDRYARGPDDNGPDRYAGGPDEDLPPPPGMMRHHHMMPPGGEPSEMESVVGAPPPAGEPMRMAMNDYPACADAGSDRCVQRRTIVYRQQVRMLRIGERG